MLVISGWGWGASVGCMCASSPQVGSIEPVCSPSPLSPRTQYLHFTPQISPPHQNTPNGKKIWHEGGGGWRPPFTVFYRARAPAEHGLKDTRRRVWRAETTEHKADGRKRSCSRLAFLQHDSSSACDILSTDAREGRQVEAASSLPDCVYTDKKKRTGGLIHQPHQCHHLRLNKRRENEVSGGQHHALCLTRHDRCAPTLSPLPPAYICIYTFIL